MRKILSLLLTLAMLIVPTSVFAETDYSISAYAVAETPVFDADFSALATNGQISDKSSNNYSVVVNLTKDEGKTETIGTNAIHYVHFGGNKIGDSPKFGNFKLDNNVLTGLDNMTLEFWTKPDVWDAQTNEKVLFAVAKGAKGNSSYDASMTENEEGKVLTVRLNQVNTVSTDITDYMNEWTHFVFVRSFDAENSTATVKVYINGAEKINETFENVTKEDESEKFLRVGTYGDNTALQLKYTYRGDIAETRVYNSALEVENINRNYLVQGAKYIESEPEPEPPVDPDDPATDENKILFDMSVGDTLAELKDVSGNNIAINTSSGVTIEKYNGGQGNINYVKTDNTAGLQYIHFTDPSLLNQRETTVEFFMLTPKLESYPNPFILGSNAINFSVGFELSFGGGTNVYDSFLLYANDNGSRLNYSNVGGIRNVLSGNSGAINGGNWTHVAITRELDTSNQSATVKVYFNGNLFVESTKTGSVLVDKDNYEYNFGMAKNGDRVNNGYNGGFSEIKVYKGILGEGEIKANFENSLAKYSPTVLTSDTLFNRNTNALSFALNGVDLSFGYEFTFADFGNPDKKINGNVTKTENGFDVTFGQYFKYGQQIQFTLATKDNDGNILKTFATKSVPKGDSEAEVSVIGTRGAVTKPDGSSSYVVDFTVHNKGANSVDYKYTFVAKDENGAAVSCSSGTLNVAGGNSQGGYSVLENAENAKEIRAYIWENKNGILVPIYGLPLILK